MLLKMSSEPEKNSDINGVVSLWFFFATVLVAAQYSLSVACLIRRAEWTVGMKVEMC